MIHLMNGKELANKIIKNSEKEIRLLKEQCLSDDFNNPTLAVVQIGYDDASNVYVRNKKLACERLGIDFLHYHLEEDITLEEGIKFIKNLNSNNWINGIMIQQPFAKHLNGLEQYVLPEKDVDGFTYNNLGRLLSNDVGFIPCTTKGILSLLDEYKIDLEGKHIVVIGRSNIVGKPTAITTLAKNATVTICHSKTKNLEEITNQADILIVAIGKPKFISTRHIGTNTDVIIDVGINRDENGKLCGDCDFDSIMDRWKYLDENFDDIPDKYITPVPGGVGPLTVASLMENVILATKNQSKIE